MTMLTLIAMEGIAMEGIAIEGIAIVIIIKNPRAFSQLTPQVNTL